MVAGHGTARTPEPAPAPSTPRPSQAQRASYSRSGGPSASQATSPVKRAREEELPATPSKRQATQLYPNTPRTPSSNLNASQRKQRDEAILAALGQGQGGTSAANRARVVSSSDTASTHYNTPPSSQMTGVSEYEVAIQTDPVKDDEAAQVEFFGSGGQNADPRSGAPYQLPALRGDDTDREEDEVENEVQMQDQQVPSQWHLVPPQTPRSAARGRFESGSEYSGSQDRNPMPTPPKTLQRARRAGRSAASRETSEERNGVVDTPTKSSSSKGKEKDMSNFARTEFEQPHASSSSYRNFDSVVVDEEITPQFIENAHINLNAIIRRAASCDHWEGEAKRLDAKNRVLEQMVLALTQEH